MVQDSSSEQYSSNSDSDNVLDNEYTFEDCSSEEKAILEEILESEECLWIKDICEVDMLGLHPYKEVLFLCESAKTGLAYHLNSSKIECLGDIYPENYVKYGGHEYDKVKYAFPYTPCWIEEFPRNH
jgi:hypothetical protein